MFFSKLREYNVELQQKNVKKIENSLKSTMFDDSHIANHSKRREEIEEREKEKVIIMRDLRT